MRRERRNVFKKDYHYYNKNFESLKKENFGRKFIESLFFDSLKNF